ncbi:MAG: hypothetical protein H8E66_22115 [Planctomycetes bacterium]|nr:hypothetical protein [Planctomycetota bacterium]
MTDNLANQNDEGETAGVGGKEAYNIVSDTVTGANVRWKDNLFQALSILVCILLGAGIGALSIEERIGGALVGGFAGMIIGVLGSGTFLMVFRAIMHMRGRHR